MRSAQAQLDSASAQLALAQDQLAYTVLKADVPGVITARYAEIGQVVAQASTIFTLARDGDRDAVFDVHETIFAQVGRGPVRVASMQALRVREPLPRSSGKCVCAARYRFVATQIGHLCPPSRVWSAKLRSPL